MSIVRLNSFVHAVVSLFLAAGIPALGQIQDNTATIASWNIKGRPEIDSDRAWNCLPGCRGDRVERSKSSFNLEDHILPELNDLGVDYTVAILLADNRNSGSPSSTKKE